MSPSPTTISAVAQDYLKAIWSATEWGGEPATVSSLSRRFSISRATVSITLGRLQALDLLRHERYGGIELTRTGLEHALAVVRRHRLLETFLVRHLGYGWDEVHDEAEVLEHSVSDTFVERIAALLGDPDTDPHGDPIPRADGTVHYPENAGPLSAAPTGSYRVLRISDADPERLRDLADRGIAPGSALRVPAALDDIPPEAAAGIIVVPAGD